MSDQQTPVRPAIPTDDAVDFRELVQQRYRCRRGNCSTEHARQQILTALESQSQCLVSESLLLLTALYQHDPAHIAVFEQYDDGSRRPAFERLDTEAETQLLTLARAEPTRFRAVLGPLLAVSRDSDGVSASAVFCSIAARDPAVLKPVVPELVDDAANVGQTQWILVRLAKREPALVQRHVANSLWTVQRALEEQHTAVTATRSLTAVLAVIPDLLPDSTIFRRLLQHPDAEMRRLGATAVPDLVASTQATLQRDEPAISALLTREMYASEANNRTAAATALGHVSRTDRADADDVLGQLTTRLPDSEPTVRTAILDAIARLVSDSPTARDAGSVERIAVFLDQIHPREALTAIDAHGQTAVKTLGVDVIAVLLGDDDAEIRRQTVQTLLSLGMGSPANRPEILDALCWALYDTDDTVRRTAVDAVGVAGRHWPGTTPDAVDALFDYLSHYSEELAVAADALATIARSVTGAMLAFIDRLLRAHAAGTHSTATVATALEVFAETDPASVETTLDWVVDCSQRPTDDGGGAAARTLLAVAEANPAVLAPYVEQLRETLADGQTTSAHWATLATVVGIAGDDGASQSSPAAWLARRFHPEPLVFGPALARLAHRDPVTALPPLEGLLVTLQRSGGERAPIDTAAALDSVVAELVGAHPVCAVPVVRTLLSVLETETHRTKAATLLAKALDAWPYLTPLATQPVLDRLADSDSDTLAALTESLARMQSPAADDALTQLADHPSSQVQVATEQARRRPPEPFTSIDLETVDPTNADISTVDTIATTLGGPDSVQTQRAVDALQQVGHATPELRCRIVTHLLGYLAGQAGGDVVPAVCEAVISLVPADLGAAHTATGDVDARSVRLLISLCDIDNPLVSTQALSALRRVVIHTDVSNGEILTAVTEQTEVDTPLVQNRAIQTLRPLVSAHSSAPSELLARLEPCLFGPHSLVPATAWTVGELATVTPECLEPVSASLTGLQDWDPLDRYNATETIRTCLGAVPSLESVFAESLLHRLAIQDAPSRSLVRTIGMLSGEAIAAHDGINRLLDALETSQCGSHRFVLAQRLQRTTESAPERVLEALSTRETLPKLCSASALPLFRTVERLIDHDWSRIDLPLLDVLALFDVRWAVDIAEVYDRDPTHPQQLQPVLTQAKRSGARILAMTGHNLFPELLAEYESSEPPVPLSPELLVTYLVRTDSTEKRHTAVERICTDAPADLCNAVATTLRSRIEESPAGTRTQLLTCLPDFAAAVTDSTIVADIVATVTDETTDEWEQRLAATETLGELGQLDAVETTRVVDVLLDILGDSEPTIRRKAAEALRSVCLSAVVDLETVIDELARLTDAGTDVTTRRGSVVALGLLAVDAPSLRARITRRLVETADATDDLLRRRTFEALVAIADVEPVALAGYLERIGCHLHDTTFAVQRSAIECLASTAAAPDLREASTRHLTDALAIDDNRIQQRGAETLTDIARTSATLPPAAIETIRAHTTATNPAVRAAVARCLSYAGSRADRTTLQRLTTDRDSEVCAAATEGLTRLDSSRLTDSTTLDDAPMYRYGPSNRGASSIDEQSLTSPSVDWQFETDGTVQAPPVAIDDTVYVGAQDHTVYALATETGEPRWQYERDDPPKSRGLGNLFGDGGHPDVNRSSPAIVGTDLYIGHCRSEGGELYNLDTETGACHWTIDLDSDVFCSPAVVDGTVYTGSSDGVVFALDAATGHREWTVTLADTITSSPTVFGETLFIGCHDGTVHALDTADGTVQWTYQTDAFVASTVAASGSTVYVGSYDAHVYALDAIDGSELWTVETAGAVHASPAVSDGTVYVASSNHVYALDAVDGTTDWTVRTDGQVDVSPAVTGGAVYVASHAGTVYALDATDGTSQWTIETGAPIQASPVVDGGTVYVGNNDGLVSAIRD